MKNYTPFPNSASTIFSPRDLYILAGLYINAPYSDPKEENLTTDTTISQLAQTTNEKEFYIRDAFLPKLRASKFTTIATRYDDYVTRRNEYTLPNPSSNFKLIRKEFFEDKSLSNKEKGFLLMLYSICINDTFRVDLSCAEMLKRFKIGKTQLYELKQSLIDKGVLVNVDSAPPELVNKDYNTGLVIMHPYLGLRSYQDIINDTIYDKDLDMYIDEALSKSA